MRYLGSDFFYLKIRVLKKKLVLISKTGKLETRPSYMDSLAKKMTDKSRKKDISNTKKKTAVHLKVKQKKNPRLRTADTSGKTNETDGEPSTKRMKLEAGPIKKSKRKIQNIERVFSWKDEEYLADSEHISLGTAKNIIELLKQENTIPFIARYRGHLTGDLTPDKLRKIKATYEYIQLLHTKAIQLKHQVLTSESANPDLLSCIQTACTLEELDFIGSSFKKDNRSLAKRAQELGLEPVSKLLLEGKTEVVLKDLVNPDKPGLEDIDKIKLGIQHIIADVISKNAEVHAYLENIYSSDRVVLQSKFKGAISDADKAVSKYRLYGNFSQTPSSIKPHQTLAINRGEAEKELTVKIIIPDSLWKPLKIFCRKKWLASGSNYALRNLLFSDSVNDAIKRLLEPLASRRIRAKLNAEAENESLGVFESNLRQLLMTPPFRGHVVMGIDPGFGKGCKVAVVSHTGEPIDSDIFYLRNKLESMRKLKNLVLKHSCKVIALGNGQGSRETEALLSECIKKGIFKPLDVFYTIIDEQGVSIYSCSSTASEEFPNMDPKIVSAISLARRLQNPLSELVKVEPKHLGVGMYQHDVKEKKLESALDEVVSECVSFVGVDVNSASFYLLKRVAGLNASKALEIIKHRTEVCSFKCREDLKKVKGIKTKTFQQCAGFIRVIPSTARCNKHRSCENAFNPLDETCIHPESYENAIKIIHRFGLNLNDLGSENFVKTVEEKTKSEMTAELAKYYNCSSLEIAIIIDSLRKPKNFDMRCPAGGPIFRKGITNLEDLKPGHFLDGVVRNIVTFGAFIDVGVSVNGLIHKSQMQNKSLQVNDRVKVQVLSTSLDPKKIELKLVSVVKELELD